MNFGPPALPFVFQWFNQNLIIETFWIFCEATKSVRSRQVFSDPVIKFVYIVRTIFCTILHAYYIKCTNERTWSFESWTLYRRRVNKRRVFVLLILLVSFFDLQPRQLMSLLVTSQLSHHIVKIDVCFWSFTSWHSLNSSLDALPCRFKSPSLHTVFIKLGQINRGMSISAHQQKYDCKIAPSMGIAADTIKLLSRFSLLFILAWSLLLRAKSKWRLFENIVKVTSSRFVFFERHKVIAVIER